MFAKWDKPLLIPPGSVDFYYQDPGFPDTPMSLPLSVRPEIKRISLTEKVIIKDKLYCYACLNGRIILSEVL